MFQAQFGFHDTVVAASSRAAALRAWGVRQDLFASGAAKAATEQVAVAAAVAHPETPLRRAVGTNDPFELEPTNLPKVPDAPRKTSTKPAQKTSTPPEPQPVADRSKLDAAEKTLRDLDERRKREEADFRAEEDALNARRQDAQSAFVDARKKATQKVADERGAYHQAGGRD